MHKLSPKDIWAHFEPVIQNMPKKITIKKAKTQPIIFFQFFTSKSNYVYNPNIIKLVH